MTRILSNDILSRQIIRLTPRYNEAAGLPSVPEHDERFFDFKRDKETATPDLVGQVMDHSRFSGHGFDRISVKIPIKQPQSDVYHLPENLESFLEPLQAIIDYEHNATPSAFNRVALLAIRHGVTHFPNWHFDADQGIEVTRTYNVSDLDPTRFAVVPLKLSRLQKFLINKKNVFDYMERAARDAWRFLSEDEHEIFAPKPYEIMRHNSMTWHRAGEHSGRTLVSVFYQSLGAEKPNLHNRGMGFMIPVSEPLEHSARLLREYHQRLKV